MIFSGVIALAVVAVSSVLAVPTARKTEPLLQWQLQTLGTFSPSGRPGSSPYSTINITIIDPNTIPVTGSPTGTVIYPASQGVCSTQWIDEFPWGQEIPCASNSTYSNWSFKLLSGTSPTTNFTIDVKLVDSVVVLGTSHTRTWSGGDHFEVGDNLQGSCGGSGVCSWGLRAPSYGIEQVEQTTYSMSGP